MVQGPSPYWKGEGTGVWGVLLPKLNIAYLSVNFACNFVQERSEDATSISQQHVTFLPHPPLYQPEAHCGNLVSSRL